MSELANEQMHQLKRMGFPNEEVAVDLRYDKDIVDIIVPDDPTKIPNAVDRLDMLGDAAADVLKELLTFAEHERTRADVAKFCYGLKYDMEKTKASFDFSTITERIQRARNIMATSDD